MRGGFAARTRLCRTGHRAACQGKERQVQLVLPSDHVIAQALAADTPTRTVTAEGIPTGWKGLDIGPQTVQRFRDIILAARTVVWNGPMGVFELAPFRQGTLAIAQAVADCQGTTVVGGGDTIAALALTDCQEHITHISTGGGASLEFLEGKSCRALPASMNAGHKCPCATLGVR